MWEVFILWTPDTVTSNDLGQSLHLRKSDIGQRREKVLVEMLGNRYPEVDLQAVDTSEWFHEHDIRALIEDHDLCLVATDAPLLNVLHRVNRVALALKKPWATVALDGLEGLVGPVFIPGETCCFMCYEMRLESNMANYEGYKTLKSCLTDEAQQVHASSLAIPQSITGLLTGQFSLEILQWLISGYSRLAGKMLRYDLQTGSVQLNTVLKLPRCPECGAGLNRQPNEMIFHTYEQLIREYDI